VSRSLRIAVAALAAVMLVTAGCGKSSGPGRTPFNGIDVTGSPMGGEFRLTDHTGKPRALSDFRGKVVLVSFGFTQCPDVCPTTLTDLAAARKQLGADASQVQVLFVTVDPQRDTTALLAQYVPAFDPTFIGLSGDDAAVAKTAKDFNMYVQQRPGTKPGTYSVDHSTQVYAFDRQGRVRLIFPFGTPVAAIASDLKVLLNS
jgi:protein SCO1/2